MVIRTRLTTLRGRLRLVAAEIPPVVQAAADPSSGEAIALDGEELRIDAMLVAVGNCQSYGGGMRVCPTADVADGLFDVTLLTPMSTMAFLRLRPSVFSGRHVQHPAVSARQARPVTVSAAGMSGYADGKPVGSLPVRAEVGPQAVTIFPPGTASAPRLARHSFQP